MHPSVWGPAFWRTIHLGALGYPERPSELQKALFRSFLVNIGDVIPCDLCKTGYRKLLASSHPKARLSALDAALDAGGEALFRWSVDLHNAVNRELGKDAGDGDWSYERAKAGLAQKDADDDRAAAARASRRTQKDADELSLTTCMVLTALVTLGMVLSLGIWRVSGCLGAALRRTAFRCGLRGCRSG